jgi:hypothetical protein
VTASVSTCGVRESESDAVALCTLEFSRGRLAQIIQNRLCKGETQYFEVRAETRMRRLRASFGGRAASRRGCIGAPRRTCASTTGVRHGVGGDRATSVARSAGIPKEPGMIATRNVFERTLDAFARGTLPPRDRRGWSRRAGGDRRGVSLRIDGRRVELDGDESEGPVRDAHGRPPRSHV